MLSVYTLTLHSALTGVDTSSCRTVCLINSVWLLSKNMFYSFDFRMEGHLCTVQWKKNMKTLWYFYWREVLILTSRMRWDTHEMLYVLVLIITQLHSRGYGWGLIRVLWYQVEALISIKMPFITLFSNFNVCFYFFFTYL